MKSMKLGGVLIATLLICAAALGANSASAATLCKANTAPCPEKEVFAAKESVKGEKLAAATIHTDLINVTCTTAEWKGETETTALGEFAGGEVTSMTFGGCGGGCVVTPINLPYKLGLAAGAGGNGTLVMAKGGGGVAMEVSCGAVISCTLAASEVPFSLVGGTPGKAIASAANLPTWVGKTCPKKLADLTAEYKIEGPASTFVESSVAAPVLCKKDESPCAVAEKVGSSTFKGEAEIESKFVYTYSGTTLEPVCKGSTFEGKVTETSALIIGEISSLVFSPQCGAGVCPIKAINTPYQFEIDRTGAGSGTMTWTASKEPITFELNCGASEHCNYVASAISFTLTGGTPAKLSTAGKVALTRKSGLELFCGATASWEGLAAEPLKYKFTNPTSLFVRS